MSKWSDGVQLYKEELLEKLEYEKLEPTLENLLNGAKDWSHYSWGGNSLIYNMDIAERLATKSEIKSRTRVDGSFNQKANKSEFWLDVQARALYQACNLILNEVK